MARLRRGQYLLSLTNGERSQMHVPPDQKVRGKSAVMRAIEANEEEARRTGAMSVEEAEADLNELFKKLEAEAAASRIKR